jgi:hypothetical protein
MIKLMMMINREILNFTIENRIICYRDRVWKTAVQVLPKDDKLIEKIKLSRNRIPEVLIKLFNISKEEMEEYNNAKTDSEIADLIIRDGKGKGCRLIKREEI